MDPITTAVFNLSTNLSSTGSKHIFEIFSPDEFYDHHRPAISLINKYVTPIWYVVGFPSNLLAFMVWVRPRMRPSSGCFLASLAMADFIFLILQLIFELQNTWNIRLYKMPGLCEAYPILFLASQYLSPLLVAGFTVERYISICHPFQREKFCTTSRAVKVIIGLGIFSVLLHAVQGYFWTYDPGLDDCTVRMSVQIGGSGSVWAIWSWITELLVFGLVPIGMLILNIMVIMETQRMSKSEETRLCLRKGHKSSAATVTLLAVSFYLIFTTLPVTVFYVLYLTFPEGNSYMTMDEISSDPTWQRHFTYYTIRTIVEELGMSHYACNFLIYFLTGKLFRRELKLLFFKYFCKDKLAKLRRGEFMETTQSFIRSSSTKQNGAVAHL